MIWRWRRRRRRRWREKYLIKYNYFCSFAFASLLPYGSIGIAFSP